MNKIYSLNREHNKALSHKTICLRGTISCLVWFTFLSFLLILLFRFSMQNTTRLLLLGSVLLVSLPFTFQYLRYGDVNWLSPVNIFLAFFTLFWISQSLYIATRGYELFYIGSFISYHDDSFNYGLMWSVVGLGVFLLSYYLSGVTGLARHAVFLFPRLIVLGHGNNTRKVRRRAYIFFLLILALYITFMIQQGGVSHFIHNWNTLRYSAGSGNTIYLYTFYMIQPVVWILFMCLVDERNNGKLKKVSILYFLFYSFVGTFILLSLGSRGAVLILWGGVMLIYHYSQKAITFKRLLSIFLLVFLFAMSFRAYRHFLARGDWGFYTISDASVFDVISRDFYATDLAYFYMDNVPDGYDFIHGQSFIGIPYFIIPRVIWSSKPKALGPDVLLIHFFPNYGLESHMGPSLIGDLYINFSYMGIVTGMSILGLYYQIIEKYLNKGKGIKIEKAIVYVISAAFAFYLFKCSVFDAVTRLIVIWVFPIFLLLYLTRIRCLTKIS